MNKFCNIYLFIQFFCSYSPDSIYLLIPFIHYNSAIIAVYYISNPPLLVDGHWWLVTLTLILTIDLIFQTVHLYDSCQVWKISFPSVLILLEWIYSGFLVLHKIIGICLNILSTYFKIRKLWKSFLCRLENIFNEL